MYMYEFTWMTKITKLYSLFKYSPIKQYTNLKLNHFIIGIGTNYRILHYYYLQIIFDTP